MQEVGVEACTNLHHVAFFWTSLLSSCASFGVGLFALCPEVLLDWDFFGLVFLEGECQINLKTQNTIHDP